MVLPFDCLLLAAGASTRMGEWKMLLPWEGRTIVETSLRKCLDACRRVILVAGHRAEELRALFAGRIRSGEVTFVVNPVHEQGMFSSVQAGAGLVTSGRFFLALADMPLVEPSVYRLLTHYEGEAVIPTYRGKKGHPLLLSSAAAQRILELPADRSMRDVLAEFPGMTVPVEEPGVVQDIDDEHDYLRHTRSEQ
ncbi:MAG: NTP transferase domain-containing protein [Spirochaetia bacterium]